MKVLFAVNREEISSQIVKKYQKEYKEIISFKNVYYFNAIIKELQRDKSYDRIVISEDLEPFANNNYDAIDKFIFEKLDNISDEATGSDGDIPIILICGERRSKSDAILVKLFGIGIYNALLGNDRNIANLCQLMNKPRSKKDAKAYYKIESNEVNYQSEDENSVSEAEIQNIINYYKKLGKNEDKFIESFDKIASQYNDRQLKIIIKFLPLNVKAALEAGSPKYQSLITFSGESAIKKQTQIKKQGLEIGFLNQKTNSRPSKPVIVPSAVNTKAAKKLGTRKIAENINTDLDIQKTIQYNNNEEQNIEIEDLDKFVTNTNKTSINKQDATEQTIENLEQPKKRGRGRPRKVVEVDDTKINVPKRGRGRPRKQVQVKANEELDINDDFLPGIQSEKQNSTKFEDFDDMNDGTTLPGFDDIQEENVLPGFDDVQEESTLPGFDDENNAEPVKQNTNKNVTYNLDDNNLDAFSNFDEISEPTSKYYSQPSTFDSIDSETIRPIHDNSFTSDKTSNVQLSNYNNLQRPNNYSNNIYSKDKKTVIFVGTTKNGTSFLVNNLGKYLSNIGIKTAILDLTQNRNSYYVYTNNEDKLRKIAYESIKNLNNGIVRGIEADRNLSVFTALPGDNINLNNADGIISALSNKYSVILIDADFNTPLNFFEIAQEIYIVQTLDILTIQPMTAFLRDLKAKNILNNEKIRIVINKEVKVRGLTSKAIIGGLAFYNDPAMSFMTELFNKDIVKYCTIPFEYEVYSKYLEAMLDCQITLSGYSKNFTLKLKELANMVYPLLNSNNRAFGNYAGNYSNEKFSSDINKTLQQMKNKY